MVTVFQNLLSCYFVKCKIFWYEYRNDYVSAVVNLLSMNQIDLLWALGLAWYTCAFGRHRLRFKSGGAHSVLIPGEVVISRVVDVSIHITITIIRLNKKCISAQLYYWYIQNITYLSKYLFRNYQTMENLIKYYGGAMWNIWLNITKMCKKWGFGIVVKY